jgi:hypothetical protein
MYQKGSFLRQLRALAGAGHTEALQGVITGGLSKGVKM